MNSNYDFILPFFTASDKLRPKLANINLTKDGYVHATDAQMLIRVSYAYCEMLYDAVPEYPDFSNILNLFLSDTIQTSKIKTDDLIACLAQYKWNRRLETKDCEKCKGKGTIECKCCHHEADCLNDGNHHWVAMDTYPKHCTEMECQMCGERRTPTADEFLEILKKK